MARYCRTVRVSNNRFPSDDLLPFWNVTFFGFLNTEMSSWDYEGVIPAEKRELTVGDEKGTSSEQLPELAQSSELETDEPREPKLEPNWCFCSRGIAELPSRKYTQ